MEQLNQQQVKQLASSSEKQKLENSFAAHWALLYANLPEPVRQHPILNPKTNRHWKLDFAWVEEKLAVEVQGGSFVRGGHNTAVGQASDYERHNALTRMGWRILYFNTIQMKHPADVVTFTAELLCNADEL